MRTSITYLGRVIDEHGVRPDPEAIKAVRDWSKPRNKQEMQSFLGFANYYREFIKGHTDIDYPMQLMIKKGNEYKWTPDAECAFERMKTILCSPPVMALPIDDAPFLVDIDALEVAVAGILQQRQPWGDGFKDRHIAYGSKAMLPEQQKYWRWSPSWRSGMHT